MTLDWDQVKARVAAIEAQSGRTEPTTLLSEIADLESEYRAVEMVPRDRDRLQTLLNDLRARFRVSRAARFRFSLGEQEPHEAAEQASAHQATTGLTVPSRVPSVNEPSEPAAHSIITQGSNFSNYTKTLFILNSDGSIHISSASNCTIIAVCHQLRLTECSECTVYASCKRPTIESCNALEIGSIAGKPHWEAVDDFGWMRGGQNPHWAQGGEITAERIEVLQANWT